MIVACVGSWILMLATDLGIAKGRVTWLAPSSGFFWLWAVKKVRLGAQRFVRTQRVMT